MERKMDFYNAILHLDSADPAMLRLVLRNASNYLAALPNERFKLEIIANGDGATLLTKDRKELHELAKPLLEAGITLKICANAMAEHKIAKDEIWPECVIVPAGLVEIVRLQKAGYSYIKP